VACSAANTVRREVWSAVQSSLPEVVMPPRNRRPTGSLGATRALGEFLATETAGGVALVVAAVIALAWANSPWQSGYHDLWRTHVGIDVGGHGLDLDLRKWVNDGLMAVFFLVVALEVKREMILGELRDRRHAALPVFAAVGGMVLPALLYAGLNRAGPAADGWGIPMATDIAFAIGVLAVVAPRIPPGVRLFLLTLAIVDDIGAIAVIAVFYTSDLQPIWLLAALAVVAAVVTFRQLGFRATPLFIALGVLLWLTVHASGLHATLAGVIMGLAVPATPVLNREIIRSRTDELLDVFSPAAARETTRIARQAVSQLEWLEHELHGWSSLVIVPVFALANAGVTFTHASLADATTSSVTIGIILGLVAGKATGITAGAWLGIRLGIAELPSDVRWRHVGGAAALGGIGFTVSLFIVGLAFDAPGLVDQAKAGIFVASLTATAVGALLLRGSAQR
jgi:NhaA family Na+:H+ antiporter